jgi:hypothetical protein
MDNGARNTSLHILRLIAAHLMRVIFPALKRPRVLPDEPPTPELIEWATKAYCFPWIKQFADLVGGVVVLDDTDNKASVRVLGRSAFELCAHMYYVKKHLKQHIQANNLRAAWEFLTPIATGSRYVNDVHPEGSDLFPCGPHIIKAVNCFKEVMPKDSWEDYSYLSEFCHPNMMTFAQHYTWTTPEVIEFGTAVAFGAYGAIAASAIQGLLALNELLSACRETQIRKAVLQLLNEMAEIAKRPT